MKRRWRIIIGVLGTLVLLVVLAVVVVKFVFTKERVLALLLPRIEKTISRKVTVGDAGISLWGGIGVWLGDITVANRDGFSPEPFLTVGEFDVKARWWPLLTGRVEIDHVRIERPTVLIEYQANGESNLAGLAAASPSAQGAAEPASDTATAPLVLLRDVSIDGGRFVLRDERVGRHVGVAGIDIAFRMADESGPSTIKGALQVVFDSLSVAQAERHWQVAAGNPHIFAAGAWDRRGKALRLDSLSIAWLGAMLTAAGTVRQSPGVTEIDLDARLSPTQVRDFLPELQRLVPRVNLAGLNATVQGTGEASFTLPLPGGSVPDWRLDVDFSDVRWPLPEYGADLAIPRIELRGSGQTASWLVHGGTFGDGTFSTSGTVDRLFQGDRTLSGRLQADVPLAFANRFVHASGMTLGGRLRADLNGFANMRDWHSAQISGRVSSDHLVATDTSWSFDSLAAAFDVQVDGPDVTIRRCDWVAGRSRGTLTGRALAIIPAALSHFRSPDVPRAELNLNCALLDLDELIGESVPPPRGSDTVGSAAVPVPLVAATGDLAADTLVYSRLLVTDAKSPFAFKERVLTIAPISGRVFNGALSGSVTWDLRTWPQPHFEAALRADSIDADGFLTRYFGWAGGMSGAATFEGKFSGQGRYAPDILPTLSATGAASLTSGRLEATPLLATVGTQLGIAGLDHPRAIRSLSVPFRIANGRLITDALRLVTEDAQLTATGSVGFDRTLDYQVRFVADNSSSWPAQLRGTALQFGLGGTVTAPSVRLDLREVGKNVVDKLLQNAGDTLKSSVGDALKNLLKPHKP